MTGVRCRGGRRQGKLNETAGLRAGPLPVSLPDRVCGKKIVEADRMTGNLQCATFNLGLSGNDLLAGQSLRARVWQNIQMAIYPTVDDVTNESA